MISSDGNAPPDYCSVAELSRLGVASAAALLRFWRLRF